MINNNKFNTKVIKQSNSHWLNYFVLNNWNFRCLQITHIEVSFNYKLLSSGTQSVYKITAPALIIDEFMRIRYSATHLADSFICVNGLSPTAMHSVNVVKYFMYTMNVHFYLFLLFKSKKHMRKGILKRVCLILSLFTQKKRVRKLKNNILNRKIRELFKHIMLK